MRIYLLMAIYSVSFTLLAGAQEPFQNNDHAVASPQASNKETAVPDYADLKYWAAHPKKHDTSDSIPLFLKGEKRDSSVDVFYIHPTTYTRSMREGAWNADINDAALNKDTDNRPVLFQASVFNGVGKIYAPRYRQAHLRAFYSIGNSDAAKAFDIAYNDVRNAFEYYLKHQNNGRPIIIASHSQGSVHAIRLLKDYFDGKALQKQLVIAYVVGWQVRPNEFKNIPFADKPEATGGVVSWRTYKSNTSDWIVKLEGGNNVSVNPITWTLTTDRTGKAQHKGMLGKDFNKLFPNSVTAKIDPATNVIWADLPEEADHGLHRTNNYHVADYNLFYMDIRENVKERVAAYFKSYKR